jgi:hypothetical protein
LFVRDIREAAYHAILSSQNGAHKALGEMLADDVGVLMNLLTIWDQQE